MQLLTTAPRYVYISTDTLFLMWVKINETQASGMELSVETIRIALFGKIFAIFYDTLCIIYESMMSKNIFSINTLWRERIDYRKEIYLTTILPALTLLKLKDNTRHEEEYH